MGDGSYTAHSKLGYFWASLDRLLGRNFHADLATRVVSLLPIQRQVDTAAGRYSGRSIQRQVDTAAGRYSGRSIQRQVDTAAPLYRSIQRRRCIDLPLSWSVDTAAGRAGRRICRCNSYEINCFTLNWWLITFLIDKLWYHVMMSQNLSVK